MDACSAKVSSKSILEYARAVHKIKYSTKPRTNVFHNQNQKSVHKPNTETHKMESANKKSNARKELKEMKLKTYVYLSAHKPSIMT